MAQRTHAVYLIELYILLTPGLGGVNETRRVTLEEVAYPSATCTVNFG